MAYIDTYPNLQVLNLTFMHSLDSEILGTILSKTPHIKKLSFCNYAANDADTALQKLVQYCPKLRQLSILKSPVTLKQLNTLVSLESLTFSFFPYVQEGKNTYIIHT